jgi:hypothetical protein
MRNINELSTSILGLNEKQLRGTLDLLAGFILGIGPWFFIGLASMPVLLGITFVGTALILYSMFTDYQYGILYNIFKKMHAVLDVLFGGTLIYFSISFFEASVPAYIATTSGITVMITALIAEIIHTKWQSWRARVQEHEWMMS